MFNYQRVLIVLPERLGDAIFHTPSIHLLRAQRPGIKIGVIALSTLAANLLENNPDINDVYVAPNKAATKHLASLYDVVLKLHDHAPARKYVEWLGIPALSYTSVPVDQHRSQRSLLLIKELLQCELPVGMDRYRLFPQPDNFKKIETLLRDENVVPGHDILIGCHIGCHSIAKRGLSFWKPLAHPKVWPLEKFVALDAALRDRDPRFRLVLTGSNAEKKMGREFKKMSPTAIDLIDKTSVLDLAALMELLTLFISSDTGTLHVACASDIGLVALFGPTSLTLTGPYPRRPNHTIVQAPILADVTVDQVFAAIVGHADIIAARAGAQAFHTN
jgi:ADP-heptose:LPS heptosyltransferase